jgi:hypothetical protein
MLRDRGRVRNRDIKIKTVKIKFKIFFWGQGAPPPVTPPILKPTTAVYYPKTIRGHNRRSFGTPS